MEPIFEMSGDAVWSPNILKLGGYGLESQYFKRYGWESQERDFLKRFLSFWI